MEAHKLGRQAHLRRWSRWYSWVFSKELQNSEEIWRNTQQASWTVKKRDLNTAKKKNWHISAFFYFFVHMLSPAYFRRWQGTHTLSSSRSLFQWIVWVLQWCLHRNSLKSSQDNSHKFISNSASSTTQLSRSLLSIFVYWSATSATVEMFPVNSWMPQHTVRHTSRNMSWFNSFFSSPN